MEVYEHNWEGHDMRLAYVLAIGLTLACGAVPASADQIVGLAGKCLNVRGASTADGTPIILYRCEGYDNEAWHFRKGRIIGLGGKCLNVQGNNSASGTPIILYRCEGGANEIWHREGRQIVGLGGKCLNVENENSADGARIILWPCEDRPNDRWRFR